MFLLEILNFTVKIHICYSSCCQDINILRNGIILNLTTHSILFPYKLFASNDSFFVYSLIFSPLFFTLVEFNWYFVELYLQNTRKFLCTIYINNTRTNGTKLILIVKVNKCLLGNH